MKSIALVSGGIDSAVLLWAFKPTRAVTFDYGQGNRKEIAYSRDLCNAVGAIHRVADIKHIFGDVESALTSEHIPVTDAASAVVPNRNLTMLSIVSSWAATRGIDTVHIGVHQTDQANYLDCTPEFIALAQDVIRTSLGSPTFTINAPFLYLEKNEIIERGHELGVPFEKTWSCYNNMAVHCGACPACLVRKKGFEVAGIKDPTQYGA